jgi:hypothetical protein
MAKGKQSDFTAGVVGKRTEEQDAEVYDEDKAMEDATRDFGEGERVIKLYRYPGEMGGRPRFLVGLAREDFNEVLVQERFGGGRYFGRWRKKNGQYTRFNFEIEGEQKIFTRSEILDKFDPTARRGEHEEEGREPYPYLNRSWSEEPESRRNSEGVGMIDVLKMMAETRKEAREEMRVMLEMMRPAQQAPDATEKVFSLVEKLAPLISQGGGDGGGNPWLFALSQLKDPIMKIVDTIQTAVQKGPAQAGSPVSTGTPPMEKRIPPPAPIPPIPEKTLEPPAPTSEDDMLAESFKDYLPLLVKSAHERKDPGLYVDLILDQVPRFAYDRLRTWLLKAGCLNDLAKYAPAISEDPVQRIWWEALRVQLIGALNEEIGDAPRNLQPVIDSDTSTSGSADSAQLPREV